MASDTHRPEQPRRRSRLTRFIIALNLIALLVLIAGMFWINMRRSGMIEERILSLQTQGALIAAALAESATLGPDSTAIDDAERAVPMMRQLANQTAARVRLFDRTGQLQLDSRIVAPTGEVTANRLPPPGSWFASDFINRLYDFLARWAPGHDYPPYVELQGRDGTFFGEVAAALRSETASAIRVNTSGDLILSVAVPVRRFRLVMGALHLTNEGGDIGAIIREERIAILQLSLVALLVMVATSVLMARNIARPIHALADAADAARLRTGDRVRIPDFTPRRDEIGDLSASLDAMTRALYARLEAIEQFAADVAHELKNPLTSLRSAVDALQRASPEQRQTLAAVITDDVNRMTRLISDISDASRLDAELSRERSAPVDLVRLAEAVAALYAQNSVKVTVAAEGGDLTVLGLDGPLGQVLRNLIDNAVSFSPPEGSVRVSLRREARDALAIVEDDGPGIPPESLEDIFRRFYTSRPDHHFGKNSGLGLSIARQIADVHGGTLTAENRPGPTPDTIAGARFTLRLPVFLGGARSA